MNMNHAFKCAVVIAAVVFIAVSAMMNALFLSSLGRTGIEIGLLAAISLASDAVKAVLPVLIVRAVMLRAFSHGFAATLMLVVVVALSLASGTGFMALTRDGAIASRESKVTILAARKQELLEVEGQIAGLAAVRPASVIEAELTGLQMDRRWALTNSCQELGTVSGRQFCTSISKVRQDLATAAARDHLVTKRQQLYDGIKEHQSTAASLDSDPQAHAIAALLGVDPKLPRVIVTSFIAVILEVFSLYLKMRLRNKASKPRTPAYSGRENSSGRNFRAIWSSTALTMPVSSLSTKALATSTYSVTTTRAGTSLRCSSS